MWWPVGICDRRETNKTQREETMESKSKTTVTYWKREGDQHVHARVPELRNMLKKGEIDRREFLRTVTLLGVSATAAVGSNDDDGRWAR